MRLVLHAIHRIVRAAEMQFWLFSCCAYAIGHVVRLFAWCDTVSAATLAALHLGCHHTQ